MASIQIDTGVVNGTRQVVRTSTGKVYVVTSHGTKVKVYRAIAGGLGPYYFDTSDAGPTDNEGVWSGDTGAFDGDTGTFASCSDTGNETLNELRGEGTNAPGSGFTIDAVYARVRAAATDSCTLVAKIYTDGEGEALATLTDVVGTFSRVGLY
jgi:hypothetical protein